LKELAVAVGEIGERLKEYVWVENVARTGPRIKLRLIPRLGIPTKSQQIPFISKAKKLERNKTGTEKRPTKRLSALRIGSHGKQLPKLGDR
jgi:hypothetical protein